MWNLQDDKELDKLSREAAENYSLDRSPDSWDKLHSRLDAEMPSEKRRRYLLFILFFLFVGSGLFWASRMNDFGTGEQELTKDRNNSTDQTASSSRSISDGNSSGDASSDNKASEKSVNPGPLQKTETPIADAS